jgi:hypothetical protein
MDDTDTDYADDGWLEQAFEDSVSGYLYEDGFTDEDEPAEPAAADYDSADYGEAGPPWWP